MTLVGEKTERPRSPVTPSREGICYSRASNKHFRAKGCLETISAHARNKKRVGSTPTLNSHSQVLVRRGCRTPCGTCCTYLAAEFAEQASIVLGYMCCLPSRDLGIVREWQPVTSDMLSCRVLRCTWPDWAARLCCCFSGRAMTSRTGSHMYRTARRLGRPSNMSVTSKHDLWVWKLAARDETDLYPRTRHMEYHRCVQRIRAMLSLGPSHIANGANRAEPARSA